MCTDTGKKVDLITERSLSPYIAPMVKTDLKRIYYERWCFFL